MEPNYNLYYDVIIKTIVVHLNLLTFNCLKCVNRERPNTTVGSRPWYLGKQADCPVRNNLTTHPVTSEFSFLFLCL